MELETPVLVSALQPPRSHTDAVVLSVSGSSLMGEAGVIAHGTVSHPLFENSLSPHPPTRFETVPLAFENKPSLNVPVSRCPQCADLDGRHKVSCHSVRSYEFYLVLSS